MKPGEDSKKVTFAEPTAGLVSGVVRLFRCVYIMCVSFEPAVGTQHDPCSDCVATTAGGRGAMEPLGTGRAWSGPGTVMSTGVGGTHTGVTVGEAGVWAGGSGHGRTGLSLEVA